MKLILCGKNTAGAEALEFAAERGDDVWAIGTAGDDGADGWQRSFKAAAIRLGVQFDQPPRINAREFVARLAAFEADALVSIQYDQILKRRLFESIGCPCLNLHFALLPRHRGVSPIAWALADGDPEAGVSLHHMIVEIDAGDVVSQRSVPIGPAETARELYDKLSALAVEMFRESHPFPPELVSRRLPQDGGKSSYHRAGDFDFSRREIDWSRSAAELRCWIQAMIFPPMQYPTTRLGGRSFAVARVSGKVGDAAGAAPGVVLARSGEGIEVAASGGWIEILELIDPASPERPAAEIIGSVEVGDRFEAGG